MIDREGCTASFILVRAKGLSGGGGITGSSSTRRQHHKPFQHLKDDVHVMEAMSMKTGCDEEGPQITVSSNQLCWVGTCEGRRSRKKDDMSEADVLDIRSIYLLKSSSSFPSEMLQADRYN